ncbi:hypothetical protein CVT25_001699 [Psilocybe cyanescens]|uniref:Uncharacterized protein n=1 Tax=Psilocybe cyanescens TaxID=93625 RepID=A0A409XHI1_PSICY|nr:hypothetical protein CVT25_001699 [Psilocybe cyanescens]
MFVSAPDPGVEHGVDVDREGIDKQGKETEGKAKEKRKKAKDGAEGKAKEDDKKKRDGKKKDGKKKDGKKKDGKKEKEEQEKAKGSRWARDVGSEEMAGGTADQFIGQGQAKAVRGRIRLINNIDSRATPSTADMTLLLLSASMSPFLIPVSTLEKAKTFDSGSPTATAKNKLVTEGPLNAKSVVKNSAATSRACATSRDILILICILYEGSSSSHPESSEWTGHHEADRAVGHAHERARLSGTMGGSNVSMYQDEDLNVPDELMCILTAGSGCAVGVEGTRAMSTTRTWMWRSGRSWKLRPRVRLNMNTNTNTKSRIDEVHSQDTNKSQLDIFSASTSTSPIVNVKLPPSSLQAAEITSSSNSGHGLCPLFGGLPEPRAKSSSSPVSKPKDAAAHAKPQTLSDIIPPPTHAYSLSGIDMCIDMDMDPYMLDGLEDDSVLKSIYTKTVVEQQQPVCPRVASDFSVHVQQVEAEKHLQGDVAPDVGDQLRGLQIVRGALQKSEAHPTPTLRADQLLDTALLHLPTDLLFPLRPNGLFESENEAAGYAGWSAGAGGAIGEVMNMMKAGKEKEKGHALSPVPSTPLFNEPAESSATSLAFFPPLDL